MMLFHNGPGEHGREFHDLIPTMRGEIARPIVGRGSATGDFDNDGRTDLLIVDYEGDPMLLHNTSGSKNHWVTLDLRAGGANRYAYGARVTVEADGQKLIGQVSPASSYLSYSDPRVHFGLGKSTKVDRITIKWPSGKTQDIKDAALDRILVIHESRGILNKP